MSTEYIICEKQDLVNISNVIKEKNSVENLSIYDFCDEIDKLINLISFTYSNTVHFAEAGMTWEDLMASKYNNSSFYKVLTSGYDGCISSYPSGMNAYDIVVMQNGEKVYLTDYIINNYVYDYTFVYETCCFVKGTEVLTSLDGDTKNIEEFNNGDEVVSYNIQTGENYIAKVDKLIENKNSINMAHVEFENGTVLDMTDYHPLLTQNGFHSITDTSYDKLVVGDIVKTQDEWSKVSNIMLYKLAEPISTYTLAISDYGEHPDDDTCDNFYANGICVHNAGCST